MSAYGMLDIIYTIIQRVHTQETQKNGSCFVFLDWDTSFWHSKYSYQCASVEICFAT